MPAHIETHLMHYAQTFEGATYNVGEPGHCHTDLALWAEEIVPLHLFLHLMPGATKQAWIDWLKDEINTDDTALAGSRGWGQLREQFTSNGDSFDPIVVLVREDRGYIWDGWHRIACAIERDLPSITMLVGRPMPESTIKPAPDFAKPRTRSRG